MKQPVIIPTGKKTATLKENYSFKLNGFTFVIPKGYSDYDGCTGGNFLLSLVGLSRFGWSNPASLPHDYIYVNKGHIQDISAQWHYISRKDTDQFAVDVLRELGYSKWTYYNVKWVIRFVGIFYWYDKKHKDSVWLNVLNKWNE